MPYDIQPQQVVNADIAAAERVVEQLRDLPTPLPHGGVLWVGQHPFRRARLYGTRRIENFIVWDRPASQRLRELTTTLTCDCEETLH